LIYRYKEKINFQNQRLPEKPVTLTMADQMNYVMESLILLAWKWLTINVEAS